MNAKLLIPCRPCFRLLPRCGAGADPVLSVEAGRLGELIEAHECVQRRYPLTQAFLHLLHNTVQVGTTVYPPM